MFTGKNGTNLSEKDLQIHWPQEASLGERNPGKFTWDERWQLRLCCRPFQFKSKMLVWKAKIKFRQQDLYSLDKQTNAPNDEWCMMLGGHLVVTLETKERICAPLILCPFWLCLPPLKTIYSLGGAIVVLRAKTPFWRSDVLLINGSTKPFVAEKNWSAFSEPPPTRLFWIFYNPTGPGFAPNQKTTLGSLIGKSAHEANRGWLNGSLRK